MEFDVLPKVFLVNRERDVPDMVAHVEQKDGLCYAPQGSVILDRYRPAESALAIVEMARKTIERSLSSDARADLQAEFPQHWLADAMVYVALEHGAAPGPAEVFTVPRDSWLPILVLARDLRWLDSFAPDARQQAIASRRPATFLRTGRLHEVPSQRPPETFGGLLDWAASFDARLPAAILRGAQTAYRELPTIVITTSLGIVGAELLLPRVIQKGIQRSAGHARVVDSLRDKIQIRRLTGAPMDFDYMLGRNLGDRPGLAGLRIVLVGCGTIGGHLARHLAQSGAGRHGLLTLVDPDVFTAGNVGRHLLGPGAIGLPKTQALVDLLRADFPGSAFRSATEGILKCLPELAGADLVVDATGEEGVSLALNDLVVCQRPIAPAALFVYLCGAGKAAQTLLVTPDQPDGACFKCLRPDLFGPREMWPLRPDLGGEEVAATCGEAAFMPYGVAAPAIAAGMATAMCLDWAAGDASPKLRTIRIDQRATVALEDVDPARQASCPACGPDRAM